MKASEEAVALQAIEFWSTVCEEEIELAIEAVEVCLKCEIRPNQFMPSDKGYIGGGGRVR